MPKSSFVSLSDRIRRARDEAGLSQRELAELVHVSVRAVQAWEAGAVPRPFTRRLLSKILDKPVAYFAEEIEEAVA